MRVRRPDTEHVFHTAATERTESLAFVVCRPISVVDNTRAAFVADNSEVGENNNARMLTYAVKDHVRAWQISGIIPQSAKAFRAPATVITVWSELHSKTQRLTPYIDMVNDKQSRKIRPLNHHPQNKQAKC